MILSYSFSLLPKSSKCCLMTSLAAGAMAAPIFMESLIPKSTIFPVVIPVIFAIPISFPRTKAALPVTVQVADFGLWFAYSSGNLNCFSALAK